MGEGRERSIHIRVPHCSMLFNVWYGEIKMIAYTIFEFVHHSASAQEIIFAETGLLCECVCYTCASVRVVTSFVSVMR